MKRPGLPRLLLLRDLLRLTGERSPLSSVACPALLRIASRRPHSHPFPSQPQHSGECDVSTSPLSLRPQEQLNSSFTQAWHLFWNHTYVWGIWQHAT